jgi:voltage-gated potassium channel
MDVGDAAGVGKQIGKVILPFAAVLFVVFAGTTGYYIIGEGRWQVFDCAYMTIITLTTVGYAETLDGFADIEHARSFTAVLLVLGIGTFLYFASSVTAVLIEGDLKRAVGRRRMQKRIRAMDQHYIVCGVGSTGRHVLEELLIAGKRCVAVDIDARLLAEIAAHYKEGAFHYVVGDATEDDVLAEAHVGAAAGVVAALADDKDNLYLTVSVRSMNPKARIIARGSDLPVLDKLRKAGAHSVVSPNYIGGMRMVSELLRPHVVRFLDEMLRDTEQNVRIEEVVVPPASPLIGKKLGDTHLRSDLDLGVVAVLDPRGERYTYNPDADVEIVEHMTLVVLGPMTAVIALRDKAAGAAAP